LAEDPKKPKKRYISTILRICIALLAIGVLCAIQDWTKLKATFSELSILALAGGVLCFMAANVIISMRWYLLLKAQKVVIPFLAGVKIHFLGLFYNNLLLSSVGGDVLRAWYVTKHTHKRLEAAFSVLFDRIIGLASLIMMAAVFYFLFPVDTKYLESHQEVSVDKVSVFNALAEYKLEITAVLAAILIIVVFLFCYRRTRKKINHILLIIGSKRQNVFSALKIYCARPFVMMSAIGLTFIAQSMSIAGFIIIGKSMGITVPLKYYFVFFPIGWVIGAIPISPGGIGVLELGLVGLFKLVGVPAAQATVLAFCQRIVFLLGSLPGIVIHLFGAHLPADKGEIFVDSDECID
jgi:uncharacterized protein (TIRG00374 family)